MSTTNYSTDSVYPSISLIRTSQVFTGTKLDKLKSNFKTWSEDAELFLTACGLFGYLDGSIVSPGTEEPRALSNWQANNKLAAALLFGTLERSEWPFLDRSKGAKACWDAIQERHRHEGPIRQVNYLQEAMSTKFSKADPLPTTAEKLCTAIDHAYDMGNITRDLMKCILILDGLTDFPHLRALISREISSSTTENPVTSIQLRKYLDDEQALQDSDTKRTGNTPDSIALTAYPKRDNIITCDNCKRPGHQKRYCISPGGGMAGKTIEQSRETRKRDREAKENKPAFIENISQPEKTKIPVQVKGIDGQTYTIYVDAEHISTPKSEPDRNFAGIAEFTGLPSDPIPDDEEYEGF